WPSPSSSWRCSSLAGTCWSCRSCLGLSSLAFLGLSFSPVTTCGSSEATSGGREASCPRWSRPRRSAPTAPTAVRRRGRGAAALDLGAEGAAAGARLEVAAQVAAPQRAAARVGQLLADLRAGGVAGGLGRHERLAGLEDERLDLVALHVEHSGDLVVR